MEGISFQMPAPGPAGSPFLQYCLGVRGVVAAQIVYVRLQYLPGKTFVVAAALPLARVYLLTGVNVRYLMLTPLFGTRAVNMSVFLPFFNDMVTGSVFCHMPLV